MVFRFGAGRQRRSNCWQNLNDSRISAYATHSSALWVTGSQFQEESLASPRGEQNRVKCGTDRNTNPEKHIGNTPTPLVSSAPQSSLFVSMDESVRLVGQTIAAKNGIHNARPILFGSFDLPVVSVLDELHLAPCSPPVTDFSRKREPNFAFRA